MSAMIHPTAVVDEGARLGEGVRVWHFCHVESTAAIGAGCSIGQNCYIGRGVTIGEHCKLQNNVSVYEGVTLGKGVFCGPSCVFTNDLTPRALYPKGRENFVKTFVGDGASIGANATIVCGRRVGRFAMIGAGAVVTQDVPDYALMLGVPARQRGYVCKCGARLTEGFICPECGQSYGFDKDGRLRERGV